MFLRTEDDTTKSRSAIETVPYEILTLIFECVCTWHDGDPAVFRNLLSQVSRKWRELIFHTPSLWSVLYLSPSQEPSQLMESLEMHLESSKTCLLDIHLFCYWDPEITEAIFDRITPHCERWRSLSVITPNMATFSHLQNIRSASLRTLEVSYFSSGKTYGIPPPSLCVSRFPNLSSLSLRNVGVLNSDTLPRLKRLEVWGYVTGNDIPGLYDILAGSQALEYLRFHLKPTEVLQHYIHRGQSIPVFLPALRIYDIITSEGISHDLSAMVQMISCPNLMSMTIQDYENGRAGDTLVQFTGNSYTPSTADEAVALASCRTPATPRLYVHSSDPYLAWTSLSPRPALIALELHAPVWPRHAHLVEAFSSLSSLERMVLRGLRASDALDAIGPGAVITIPNLRTLDIEFYYTRATVDRLDGARFLGLFSMPNLESLRLANLHAAEWDSIIRCCCCSDRANFRTIRSLTLVDMKDFLSSANDLSRIFPCLTDLQLVSTRSNDFLRHILYSPPNLPISSLAWPELRALAIHGDNLISKSLLYRVLEVQSGIGRPIDLTLDEGCFGNQESLDWLSTHSNLKLVAT
ncbi:hypothetical protein AMATHDRAFT_47369 [Amanita thiersii Skay4041]|uniref:F-box domain-containing protein n=1 Tax=Amanita thiersii Skay4041 TaxID=703135 RepID=A0A2A9NP43_9AGAR|nr:hypothetical protein AMATHDRAFT_47369 [Amanita thiersii Skay4041]